jgi:hypothetical protein
VSSCPGSRYFSTHVARSGRRHREAVATAELGWEESGECRGETVRLYGVRQQWQRPVGSLDEHSKQQQAAVPVHCLRGGEERKGGWTA